MSDVILLIRNIIKSGKVSRCCFRAAKLISINRYTANGHVCYGSIAHLYLALVSLQAVFIMRRLARLNEKKVQPCRMHAADQHPE